MSVKIAFCADCGQDYRFGVDQENDALYAVCDCRDDPIAPFLDDLDAEMGDIKEV